MSCCTAWWSTWLGRVLRWWKGRIVCHQCTSYIRSCFLCYCVWGVMSIRSVYSQIITSVPTGHNMSFNVVNILSMWLLERKFLQPMVTLHLCLETSVSFYTSTTFVFPLYVTLYVSVTTVQFLL